MTLRAAARGRLASPAPSSADPCRAPDEGRRAVHLGGWRDLPIVPQAAIVPGRRFAGPLMIEQPLTSLLVPDGWHIAGAHGGLVAEREAA